MRLLATPMRALILSLVLPLLLAGCATTPTVPPLSPAQVVEMSKQGQTPEQIIAELRRTNTVFNLQGSDYARLGEAGVQPPVLDYLQRVQVEEMMWRQRMLYGPSWGPYGFYGGGFYGSPFFDCPGGLRLRRGPFC